MKTWVFHEETLNRVIDEWIDKQCAVGHPKATEKNVRFVAEACRDILEHPKLIKNIEPKVEMPKATVYPSEPKVLPASNFGVEKVKNTPSEKTHSLTLDEVRKAWEAMK